MGVGGRGRKRFKALPRMTGPLPAHLAKHQPPSHGWRERPGAFSMPGRNIQDSSSTSVSVGPKEGSENMAICSEAVHHSRLP